jgi:hypothetical protein
LLALRMSRIFLGSMPMMYCSSTAAVARHHTLTCIHGMTVKHALLVY